MATAGVDLNDSSGSLNPGPQSVSGQSSVIAFSMQADPFSTESGLEKRTQALNNELLNSWSGDIQVAIVVLGYRYLVLKDDRGTYKAFLEDLQFIQ